MFNQHPEPTYNQYKVRQIAGNKMGAVFGITIPRDIALAHENITFTIEESGGNLILRSGLDIKAFKREVREFTFEVNEKD